MQWSTAKNAGFTAGKPWFTVNENHTFINAEQALSDENSVFHYYRKLIQLRKSLSEFRDGSFNLLVPDDEKVFAYTRDTASGHLLVVCNFSSEIADFSLPEAFENAQTLISNYSGEMRQNLRPYEAKMLYYKEIF